MLLTVLSVSAAGHSARTQADDNTDQSTWRTQVQRNTLTSLLSELSFVIPLGISAIQLAQRLLPGVKPLTTISAIGLVVLVTVVVISNVTRAGVQLAPPMCGKPEPRNPRPDPLAVRVDFNLSRRRRDAGRPVARESHGGGLRQTRRRVRRNEDVPARVARYVGGGDRGE